MTLDQTIKYITDTGATILLAGVFLYIIIRISNIWISRLEKKSGIKQHDEALDLRNSVNDKIHQLLQDYIIKWDAYRVQVMEFSNTTQSVAYLPFKYMTCTYDVYEYGREPIGHKIDRISTSLFTPFFSYLQEHPYYEFNYNATDTGPDSTENIGSGIMPLLEDTKAKDKVLSIMLKGCSGKSIGFMSVQNAKFDKKSIAEAQRLSDHVSALLSVIESSVHTKPNRKAKK